MQRQSPPPVGRLMSSQFTPRTSSFLCHCWTWCYTIWNIYLICLGHLPDCPIPASCIPAIYALVKGSETQKAQCSVNAVEQKLQYYSVFETVMVKNLNHSTVWAAVKKTLRPGTSGLCPFEFWKFSEIVLPLWVGDASACPLPLSFHFSCMSLELRLLQPVIVASCPFTDYLGKE